MACRKTTAQIPPCLAGKGGTLLGTAPQPLFHGIKARRVRRWIGARTAPRAAPILSVLNAERVSRKLPRARTNCCAKQARRRTESPRREPPPPCPPLRACVASLRWSTRPPPCRASCVSFQGRCRRRPESPRPPVRWHHAPRVCLSVRACRRAFCMSSRERLRRHSPRRCSSGVRGAPSSCGPPRLSCSLSPASRQTKKNFLRKTWNFFKKLKRSQTVSVSQCAGRHALRNFRGISVRIHNKNRF